MKQIRRGRKATVLAATLTALAFAASWLVAAGAGPEPEPTGTPETLPTRAESAQTPLPVFLPSERLPAGSAVAFSLSLMPAGGKLALFVVGTTVMGLMALTLWFTAVPVYSTYPVAQLSALGRVHFILGAPLMAFAIGTAVAALLRNRSSTEDEKALAP